MKLKTRFDSVQKAQPNLNFSILFFFQIFMIRFERIELATYPNKPLDSMDFNSKEALNSSSVESNRIMKILKKCQKTLKIRNIVRPIESFTVFNHCEVIDEIFVKLIQIVFLKMNLKKDYTIKNNQYSFKKLDTNVSYKLSFKRFFLIILYLFVEIYLQSVSDLRLKFEKFFFELYFLQKSQK